MNMEATRILITGATGTVGRNVLRFLSQKEQIILVAAVRNVTEAEAEMGSLYPRLEYVEFDFEQPETFRKACQGIDIVFLLRPPHLVSIKKYFSPFVAEMLFQNSTRVVFLSVQGAEKNAFLPHRKIEKLLQAAGMEWIFVRPGYFMQNLTSTFRKEIRDQRQITIPAGRAKFSWTDAEDVAKVVAELLVSFNESKNRAFEITGSDTANFSTVAHLLSQQLGDTVTYKNVNVLTFFLQKYKQKIPASKILVMLLLHVMPRFQSTPVPSPWFHRITKQNPTSLRKFLRREAHQFEKKVL